MNIQTPSPLFNDNPRISSGIGSGMGWTEEMTGMKDGIEGGRENTSGVPRDYHAYSCMIPFARTIGQPWVSYENVCPCDLEQANISGRGFVPCSIGTSKYIEPKFKELQQVLGYVGDSSYMTETSPVSQNYLNSTHSLYQDAQFTPPQLDPRPLKRVGYQWRN